MWCAVATCFPAHIRFLLLQWAVLSQLRPIIAVTMKASSIQAFYTRPSNIRPIIKQSVEWTYKEQSPVHGSSRRDIDTDVRQSQTSCYSATQIAAPSCCCKTSTHAQIYLLKGVCSPGEGGGGRSYSCLHLSVHVMKWLLKSEVTSHFRTRCRSKQAKVMEGGWHAAGCAHLSAPHLSLHCTLPLCAPHDADALYSIGEKCSRQSVSKQFWRHLPGLVGELWNCIQTPMVHMGMKTAYVFQQCHNFD